MKTENLTKEQIENLVDNFRLVLILYSAKIQEGDSIDRHTAEQMRTYYWYLTGEKFKLQYPFKCE